MKIVIINSMWCSACLVMKSTFNKLSDKYDTQYLDYDMDEEEVLKYNMGNILPVIIIFKDNSEVKRIIGEKTEKEVLSEVLKHE